MVPPMTHSAAPVDPEPAEDPAVTHDFLHPSMVPPMTHSAAPVDPEPAEDPAGTHDFLHPSMVPPMTHSAAPVDPERQNQDKTPVPRAETTSPPDPETLAEMITFPPHIYTKALKLPADERLRFAGQLAAQVLKENPQLIEKLGESSDPVPAWNTLRNVVMRHIEQHTADQNMCVA
jgi:hypothetical protein